MSSSSTKSLIRPGGLAATQAYYGDTTLEELIKECQHTQQNSTGEELVKALFEKRTKLKIPPPPAPTKKESTDISNDSDVNVKNDPVTHPPSFLRIVAPMVRYSKLPFRLLCRDWGADVTHTPMILADGFTRSQQARDSEFSTTPQDRPLIVQFASKNPIEFGLATSKVVGYADAVDLNCGCPQKWAISEGIGGALSAQPELVAEMVKEAKNFSNLPINVKIRLHKDMRVTIDLVRKAIHAGAGWVTVHGRTVDQRTQPVNVEAVALVRSASPVPIVFNGDAFSWQDCERFVEATGVAGVMSARGALANPALFAGYQTPPAQLLADYMKYALLYGGMYRIHHHHLAYMAYPLCTKAERKELASIRSMVGLTDWLEQRDFWTGLDLSPTAAESQLANHVSTIKI